MPIWSLEFGDVDLVAAGQWAPLPDTLLHEQYRITVTVDPNLNQMAVFWYGTTMFTHYIAGNGPVHVLATPYSATSPTSHGHRL